jgi:hypothetical protein
MPGPGLRGADGTGTPDIHRDLSAAAAQPVTMALPETQPGV